MTEVLANNFSLLEPKSVTEQRPQASDNGNNFANPGNNFANDSFGSNQSFSGYNNQQDSPSMNDNSFGGSNDPFAGGNNNPFPIKW